jgi:hypothetical protein
VTPHPCAPAGAKNLAQAQENLGALGWRLSSGEVQELDRAAAGVKKGMVRGAWRLPWLWLLWLGRAAAGCRRARV